MSPSPEDRDGGERHGGPPEADELYDERTLAAIEAWQPPPPAGSSTPAEGRRRRRAAGVAVSAALLGLGEALEGRRPRERPPIVVDAPGEPPDPDALVVVDFDPGSPWDTVARRRRPQPAGGGDPPGP